MARQPGQDQFDEYRHLMEVPDRFEDGFDIKTVVGALFVGLVMLPGSIYLGLMAGQQMGPAAVWVTVILFSEVMRRSFSALKRQEVYLLFYIASGLTVMVGFALAGGPFAALIWNQYLVQNPDAVSLGIAQEIPHWAAPPVGGRQRRRSANARWNSRWSGGPAKPALPVRRPWLSPGGGAGLRWWRDGRGRHMTAKIGEHAPSAYPPRPTPFAATVVARLQKVEGILSTQ